MFIDGYIFRGAATSAAIFVLHMQSNRLSKCNHYSHCAMSHNATKCPGVDLGVVCPLLKWPGGLSQQRPRNIHNTRENQQRVDEMAVIHVQRN